ncbi:hypothetical protein L6Q79_16165, partial [bacterium]|nr:hypothetical protein [bacterium]
MYEFPHDDPENNLARYRMLQGLRTDGSVPYGTFNRWLFPGNPFVGTNIDNSPADKRILLSTGPFRMEAGSTQEIWAAVVGGSGDDHLSAVARLWANDSYLQRMAGSGFTMPSAPDAPQCDISARDGNINITWKNNAESVPDNFGENAGITKANGFRADYITYDFQGYRVYRSLTGIQGGFTKIAEFDKADTLGTIFERQIDENNNLTSRSVHLGDNTGLRYAFSDSSLINGHTYYYAVTAYD